MTTDPRLRRTLDGAVTCACLTMLLAAMSGLAGCVRAEDETPAVNLFAAASLTDVVTELASVYEQRGVEVVCNFASSATLARQIQDGATADVFMSANIQWVDHLATSGLIDRTTTRTAATNRLALIAPAGDPFDVTFNSQFDFATAFRGRLAIGDPNHVPAGVYARQALRHYRWWAPISPRVIPAMDVRDALRLVAMGEVGAGIVYVTDARANDRVTIVAGFPPGSHDPIVYPIAACTGTHAGTAEFIDFVMSDAATVVFERHGFTR